MITISLCMIVKNEEDILERCLSCVEGIADEIVIVDTGSTDRTKEIASRFTDRSMSTSGKMISGRPGTIPFPRPRRNIVCGWMRDDVIPEEERKSCVV